MHFDVGASLRRARSSVRSCRKRDLPMPHWQHRRVFHASGYRAGPNIALVTRVPRGVLARTSAGSGLTWGRTPNGWPQTGQAKVLSLSMITSARGMQPVHSGSGHGTWLFVTAMISMRARGASAIGFEEQDGALLPIRLNMSRS